jgi:hypothetical protein
MYLCLFIYGYLFDSVFNYYGESVIMQEVFSYLMVSSASFALVCWGIKCIGCFRMGEYANNRQDKLDYEARQRGEKITW